MKRFKEKLNEFLRDIKFHREKIFFSVLFLGAILGLFLVLYFFGNYLFKVLWVSGGVLLVTSILVIAFKAGYAVIESLFYVAAELSLLILLAQSYCSIPGQSSASHESLQRLFSIGILYIIYRFGRSLYKILKKNYNFTGWSCSTVFYIFFYFIYIFAFIGDIYVVVKPIIIDLCVYK